MTSFLEPADVLVADAGHLKGVPVQMHRVLIVGVFWNSEAVAFSAAVTLMGSDIGP
jgi:hypothetical protein